MLIDLNTVGDVREIAASQTGPNIAGGNAITADLPNGPNNGNVWIVDYVSVMDVNFAAAGFSVILNVVGIVPLNSPPVQDTTTSLDFQNRGIDPGVTGAIRLNVPFRFFEASNLTAKRIIPYGYTLRGILAFDPTVPANFPGASETLSIRAIVREFKLPMLGDINYLTLRCSRCGSVRTIEEERAKRMLNDKVYCSNCKQSSTYHLLNTPSP